MNEKLRIYRYEQQIKYLELQVKIESAFLKLSESIKTEANNNSANNRGRIAEKAFVDSHR